MLILLTIGIADYLLFRNKPIEKIITYDRIDLLAEEKKDRISKRTCVSVSGSPRSRKFRLVISTH